MHLTYYKASPPNFGDDLNDLIFTNIFGKDFKNRSTDTFFYGIGSIIDNRIPLEQKSVIFGTGIRDPHLTYSQNNWDIRFVRGPISANVLNTTYITDSAYCLKFLLDKNKPKSKYRISLMPYFRHMELYNWKLISNLFNINIINPSDKIEHVINEIGSSEKLISGAMHGAIVADVFRIPWVRLKLGPSGQESPFLSELKWKDWLLSMKLVDKNIDIPVQYNFNQKLYKYKLEKLHNTFLLIKHIRKAKLDSLYQVSNDDIFKIKIEELRHELFSFCEDYRINTCLLQQK